MKASLAALLFLAWTADGVAAQEVTSPAEGMRLLRQMATAARELTYTGTFVYKHGGQMETSRIWHLTDATGDYERLETLDGPPREVVRANEQVTCFYPGDKTAKVEQWTAARRFPAVVSEQLSAIVSNYSVRKGALARVAGHDCRIAVLEPRDALRYGHIFCAELKTGLPLRATTVNERNETVEMFAFTQVQIGGPIPREQLLPSYDPHAPGWKVDQSSSATAGELDLHWMVVNRPTGFRRVLELKRNIQGKSAAQIVFSDGLAAVSVFIEPAVAGTRAAQEFSRQGAINIFTRTHSGYVVTALGEAPSSTVMQFANSVIRARPAP
jgi:sigma-E factor negative regulatory protein RseB